MSAFEEEKLSELARLRGAFFSESWGVLLNELERVPGVTAREAAALEHVHEVLRARLDALRAVQDLTSRKGRTPLATSEEILDAIEPHLRVERQRLASVFQTGGAS